MELDKAITYLPQKLPARGWWNKVLLFDPELPPGINVYVDLDTVIIQNFDEEIAFAIQKVEEGAEMCCVSDAISWLGCKFSSSLMIFRTGAAAGIWEEFQSSWEKIERRPGGDQVWMAPMLKRICYLDESYPNLKKNLKFQLAKKTEDGRFILPSELPDVVKLVSCSGRPKPHELAALPYVKAFWHDI
jgi:hypothetical protein